MKRPILFCGSARVVKFFSKLKKEESGGLNCALLLGLNHPPSQVGARCIYMKDKLAGKFAFISLCAEQFVAFFKV